MSMKSNSVLNINTESIAQCGAFASALKVEIEENVSRLESGPVAYMNSDDNITGGPIEELRESIKAAVDSFKEIGRRAAKMETAISKLLERDADTKVKAGLSVAEAKQGLAATIMKLKQAGSN